MITEPAVKRAIKTYYDNKGFKEVDSREGHERGWDLIFRDRRGGRYVYVEAKGEGKGKTTMEHNIIHGLGQIVTRFKHNRNCAHCLALPASWKKRALGKVSKDVLRALNLRVAFVDANKQVEEITLRNFGVYNSSQARSSRLRTGQHPRLLDLAVKILAKHKKPLDCRTIVTKVLDTGLWQAKGKTPAATLHAAISREISKKGDASRFRKTERGKFTLAK